MYFENYILLDKRALAQTHRRARRGEGAAAPHGLKIFTAISIFRASASWSKILNDKKIFDTVKSFRAHSVF